MKNKPKLNDCRKEGIIKCAMVDQRVQLETICKILRWELNSKSMFFRPPKARHLRAMFSPIHPDLHPCYIAKMVLYFS